MTVPMAAPMPIARSHGWLCVINHPDPPKNANHVISPIVPRFTLAEQLAGRSGTSAKTAAVPRGAVTKPPGDGKCGFMVRVWGFFGSPPPTRDLIPSGIRERKERDTHRLYSTDSPEGAVPGSPGRATKVSGMSAGPAPSGPRIRSGSDPTPIARPPAPLPLGSPLEAPWKGFGNRSVNPFGNPFPQEAT